MKKIIKRALLFFMPWLFDTEDAATGASQSASAAPSDQPSLEPTLKVRIGGRGKIVDVTPVAVQGLRLIVEGTIDGGQFTGSMGEGDCLDPVQFVQHWQRLGGNEAVRGWKWASDGQEYSREAAAG